MDVVERVKALIEERRTVRRFFGRRAIDKSCGEVVHNTDPDGPISDRTILVVERIDLPNFQGEAAAVDRADELYDDYTARAAIAAVLDSMAEPSAGVLAAGADVQTGALIAGPRPIFLAMLSAMRAEMLGAIPPADPE